MNSLLITFEGGEGVGKSTQIRKIHQKITDLKIESILTREPGGCPSAERIRETMLGSKTPLDHITQLFLVMAARKEHCIHAIEPALSSKKWVLCDRFIDSTLVYQGLQGTSFEDILKIHNLATNNLMPDITFILDVDPQISLMRMKQRGIENSMDSIDINRHNTLRNAYLNLKSLFPDRIHIIDSSGNDEDTSNKIMKILENWKSK